MKIVLSLIISCCLIASSMGRPQPQQQQQQENSTPDDAASPDELTSTSAPPPCTGSIVVQCKSTKSAKGVWDFTCENVNKCDLTIHQETNLLLKSPKEADDQVINVIVPNYKIAQVIKTSSDSKSSAGRTEVNIQLKKPSITTVNSPETPTPAGEGEPNENEEPAVQIEYEPIPPTHVINFPEDEAVSSSSPESVPSPTEVEFVRS